MFEDVLVCFIIASHILHDDDDVTYTVYKRHIYML